MRKTIGFAGLAVLLALAACTPQTQLLMSLLPDGAVSIMLGNLEGVSDVNRQKLADFEQRRDWDGLARFAEENLVKDKSNADWWTVAGYAYSRLGRYPRAVECYAEVVRLTPDDMTGWQLLAQAYRSAGQPERAIRTLNNALNVWQKDPVTYFLLGESYSDLGRQKSALENYQQALKLNPEFARAWFGIGQLYVKQGRNAQAADVVKVLEKLDPGLAAELAKRAAQKK